MELEAKELAPGHGGMEQNCSSFLSTKKITPWKIKIEPENDGLEDDFPFPGVYSQVPC